MNRLVEQKDNYSGCHAESFLGYANLFSVAYAYPITIFDIYRSSFVNQILHCFFIASFSCPVQRSFLIESIKIQTKIIQTSAHDFQ